MKVPTVGFMRVIPVAGRDGMLLYHSEAHAPLCDTHNPWR